MPADFSPSLIRLLDACVPTYLAAEFLLFLARHPGAHRTPEELVDGMRPVVITVSAVKEYLTLFVARGVVRQFDGHFTYQPDSPELEGAIADLMDVYNERPVTLISAIHRIADRKIHSLADSSKFTDD